MSCWSVYKIPGELHVIPTIIVSKTFFKPITPHIIDTICICCPKVNSIIDGVRLIVHQEEN